MTREELEGLTSAELYRREEVSHEEYMAARAVLDQRVREWVADGWTQEQMADEMQCSRTAVRNRLKRLEIQTKDPRGRKALLAGGAKSAALVVVNLSQACEDAKQLVRTTPDSAEAAEVVSMLRATLEEMELERMAAL